MISEDQEIIALHKKRAFSDALLQYIRENGDRLHIVSARNLKGKGVNVERARSMLKASFDEMFAEHLHLHELESDSVVSIQLSDPFDHHKTKFHHYVEKIMEDHREAKVSSPQDPDREAGFYQLNEQEFWALASELYLMILGDSKSDFYGSHRGESVAEHGILPVLTPRPGSSGTPSPQSLDQVIILLEALEEAYPDQHREIKETCQSNPHCNSKILWANFLDGHENFRH